MDHVAGRAAADLVARFEREDNLDALDQAIALYETDGGLPYGTALLQRHSRTGAPEDLDRAVAVLLDTLKQAPEEAAQQAARLVGAADALVARWDVWSDPADVEAAIGWYRQALQLTPESAATRSKLGLTIARRRLLGGGDDGDLTEALSLCEEAVALHDAAGDVDGGKERDSDRAIFLDRLALVMSARAVEVEDQALAQAAVETAEGALALLPANGPRRWELETTHVSVLVNRYALRRHPDDLAAANAACASLLETMPSDVYGRRVAHVQYGMMAAARFGDTRDRADREHAIAVLREALGEPHPGSTAVERIGDGLLRTLLWNRMSDGPCLADVDELIARLRALRADAPDNADLRQELYEASTARFSITGDPADLPSGDDLPDEVSRVSAMVFDAIPGTLEGLDAAVASADRVLASQGHDEHRVGSLRLNLSGALHARFSYRGDRWDLGDSVNLLAGALADAPAGSLLRGRLLNQLALYRTARYDVTGDPADLEAASAYAAEAAGIMTSTAAAVSASDKAIVDYTLGQTAVRRYRLYGDPEELVAAIAAFRAAVNSVPTRHPQGSMMKHALGHGLFLLFERTGRSRDLRAAVRALEASVAATPLDDSTLGDRAAHLGVAFDERYRRWGRRRDRNRAMECFRLSAEAVSATPLSRLVNMRQLAGYTLRHGSPVEALNHYRVCVQELLPLIAWRGLDRISQEQQLKRVTGLASEAAAAALVCGSPSVAVQLLEQGRSVLWAQLLETRSDRSDLHGRYPQLAAELDTVTAVLNDRGGVRDLSPLWFDDDGSLAGGGVRQEAERTRRAATRFAELRDQIRELPGFEAFLRPPDVATLRRAADQGPVVMVNMDRLRCDALLLTADDVQVIPLPQLDKEDADRRARVFHRALGEASGSRTTRVVAAQTVLATLEWLWEAVVQPVLGALALTAGSGALSRVWWCPTGSLAMLPLHAAGRHRPGDSGEWAGDYVVSSYTPTLHALLHARSVPPAPAPASAATLVTALHVTPRVDAHYLDLPHVSAEIQAVRDALGSRAIVLEDAAATRRGVLETIPAHPRVHFACHGRQNAGSPSASHLALYDADLTVLDLTTVGVDGGELAFLSACETAQGDAALTDEAIHLAAAFHLAGYRHVIGTLWSLNDASAAEVAQDVYRELARPGGAEPAVALHQAVVRLRELPAFRNPMMWAPYVHIGA
ncbi:CHAT domain-containing protein [Nonomuraea polychroma]|uniref:CHAT domain-containing protein n=1 Tax=Nonomuraea polychroma TaxID=46176 RepID=UPI003D8DA7C5